jgi:hypothetical protein
MIVCRIFFFDLNMNLYSCLRIFSKMRTSIAIIRTLWFIILTAGVSFVSHTAMYKKWEPDIRNDFFKITNCDPLIITESVTSKHTWEEKLTNKHYQEYVFNINNNVTDEQETIYYHTSRFFITVDPSVLRPLTFGLLPYTSYRINVETTCDFGYEKLKQLFNDIDRVGFLSIKKKGKYHVLPSKEKYKVPESHYFLFSLNGCMCILFYMYITYFGGRFCYREWILVSNRYAQTVFKHASDRHTYRKNRHEACGLFFLLDHIVGNPRKNRRNPISGLIGTTVHVICIVIPSNCMTVYMYFSSNKITEWIVFIAMVSYFFVSSIYALLYYLNLRWKRRRKFAYIFYVFVGLQIFLAIGYLCNSFLWFLFSMSLEPIRAGSVVLLFGSGYYYIEYMYKNLLKIRKKLKFILSDRSSSDFSATKSPSEEKKEVELPEKNMGESPRPFAEPKSPTRHVPKLIEEITVDDADVKLDISRAIGHITDVESDVGITVPEPAVREHLDKSRCSVLEEIEMSDRKNNKQPKPPAEIIMMRQLSVKREVTQDIELEKQLKQCKLGHREIFVMVCYGFVIFMLMLLWIVVSWSILGISTQDWDSLISAIMIPIFTFYTKTSQMNQVKSKIQKNHWFVNMDELKK